VDVDRVAVDVGRVAAAWVPADRVSAPSAGGASPTTRECRASMNDARTVAWPSSARARPITRRCQPEVSDSHRTMRTEHAYVLSSGRDSKSRIFPTGCKSRMAGANRESRRLSRSSRGDSSARCWRATRGIAPQPRASSGSTRPPCIARSAGWTSSCQRSTGARRRSKPNTAQSTPACAGGTPALQGLGGGFVV